MSTPKTPQNDGGPAFPKLGQQVNFGNGWLEPQLGMTLRDWFAGQALTGIQTQWSHIELYLLSCGNGTSKEVREFMAWASYEQADAMIAAREAKQ